MAIAMPVVKLIILLALWVVADSILGPAARDIIQIHLRYGYLLRCNLFIGNNIPINIGNNIPINITQGDTCCWINREIFRTSGFKYKKETQMHF